MAALAGLALVAHAAISSIQPASGETTPGGSVLATVTVDSGILSPTCLTAPDDPANFVVTFDGLPSICGTGTWFSTMEVSVSSLTAPDEYTIMVQEIDLLGSLLESHPWPLTVTAPATTTTLLPDPTLPTITLFPTTTTTTLRASTTTTTTLAPGGSITDDPDPSPVVTSTTTIATGSGATGQETGTTSPTGLPGSTASSGPDDESALAASRPRELGENEPFSEIAISSGLIEVADRALPPVFAQAVLSPIILLEVLLRALGRTTAGLIIPLALTAALGLGLTRRLRRDAENLPELDDLVEIPGDEGGNA